MPFLLDSIRTIALLGGPAALAAYVTTAFISSAVLALALGLLVALVSVALSAALAPAVRYDLKTVISVFRQGIARSRPFE